MASASKLLKGLITLKGAIYIFEQEKLALSRLFQLKNTLCELQYGNDETYQIDCIKEHVGDLENCITFDMLKARGKIEMDETMRIFKEQNIPQNKMTKWIEEHVLIKGKTSKSFKELLIEQTADAIMWRLMVTFIFIYFIKIKSNIEKIFEKKKESELVENMKKLYEEIVENEIAAEAAGDVLWEYCNLGELMGMLQQKSINAFMILLHMLLTCTNPINNIIHSNKEARLSKEQLYITC